MSIVEKIPFSKLFRWFAKGYSLVFLSCYVFSRFILFRFSSFRLSTGSDQLTTRTYSSNLIGLLFEPTILLLIIGGLLYLALKENTDQRIDVSSCCFVINSHWNNSLLIKGGYGMSF